MRTPRRSGSSTMDIFTPVWGGDLSRSFHIRTGRAHGAACETRTTAAKVDSSVADYLLPWALCVRSKGTPAPSHNEWERRNAARDAPDVAIVSRRAPDGWTMLRLHV